MKKFQAMVLGAGLVLAAMLAMGQSANISGRRFVTAPSNEATAGAGQALLLGTNETYYGTLTSVSTGNVVLVNGTTVAVPNFKDGSLATFAVGSGTNITVTPINLLNAQIAAGAAIVKTKLENSAALTVVGRSANSSGSPADIAATVDGQVLMRSNSVVSFQGITDAQVGSAAGIARSKVAAGTANHIVINDGSGNMSSEATLGAARVPAFTGAITTPGGSLATTLTTNQAQEKVWVRIGTTNLGVFDNITLWPGANVTMTSTNGTGNTNVDISIASSGGGGGSTPTGTGFTHITGGAQDGASKKVALNDTADVSGAAAIGNGGTGQTTATAAYDALSPNTTLGDLIYYDGTHNVRLGPGTIGQQLRIGVAGIPEWVNPPCVWEFSDSSVTAWTSASANSGSSSAAVTGEAGHLGVYSGSTGALTNGAGGFRMHTAVGTVGAGRVRLLWLIKTPPALSGAVDKYEIFCGFSDNNTGQATDGIYFDYTDDLSSGNWAGKTANNSSRTTASAGTGNVAVVASTWYWLYVTATSTSADFYVAADSGTPGVPNAYTFIGSCASNIPTAVGREFGLEAVISKEAGSSGTAPEVMLIDRCVLVQ